MIGVDEHALDISIATVIHALSRHCFNVELVDPGYGFVFLACCDQVDGLVIFLECYGHDIALKRGVELLPVARALRFDADNLLRVVIRTDCKSGFVVSI